ncbi:MAG: Uncharacterized protein G01um101438_139 [Parcubacteria group bacterium Gr01-1014_38]|nr:MAG: Uncharacterized protein G01um101438_139 [Parcubacteria group bacterium Gr01-1014_38]
MSSLPFHSVRKSNRRAHDGKRNGARSSVYWSIERVKDGVERFVREHGRFPSAVDFDRVPYLPTARWVNMYFGNFREFRKQLGLIAFPDLTRGIHRSKLASNIGKRGIAAEREVRDLLIQHFGEMFVHVERRIDVHDTKTTRLDLFVFNATQDFGVDVLCTSDAISLRSHIALKCNKYRSLSFPVFLVVCGDTLVRGDIEQVLRGALRDSKPSHIRILDLPDFREVLQNFRAYQFKGKNSE